MADPHAVADKARRVRAMFAAIAPAYDLNNRLHSLGRDQAWRRAAVRAADLRPGETVLDVACGTGDLVLAFVQAGAGSVVGVDFTVEMLELARRKAESGRVRCADRPDWETDGRSAQRTLPAQRNVGSHAAAGRALTPALSLRRAREPEPVFVAGDALRLPVVDASFDVVSIAFGIRNVADPGAALREFHRVLRPGGRAVILEFSLPANRLLRGLYRCYFDHVLPRTAGWIARDRVGAYRYLPRSVGTFVDRQAMLGLMRDAGFEDLTLRVLTLGIAVIYRGVKGGGRRPVGATGRPAADAASGRPVPARAEGRARV